MKIVGFVEGAWGDSPGIVSVPSILKNTAAVGHQVVLLMGGPPSLGSDEFIVADASHASLRAEGSGTFGVISIKARQTWSFCPLILWNYARLVRDSDFVTLHSLYSFPVLAGYLLAKYFRKPYGIYPHGVLAPFQRTVSAQKKWIYNRIFANHILQNAAVIFFSAEGERVEASELNLRSPSVVIPDGFSPDELGALPERGLFRKRFLNGHGGPLVLFLARLNAKKGLDLLIEAMQKVINERPDVRLAIVGPADPVSFKTTVERWVKEKNIGSQTVLTGAAYNETRLQAFADADVFVLPSYAENFGFSVFEAMACGLPVVVSETLNFAKEFADSGAGFSLPRMAEAFSDAILKLLNQPELRRKMGDQGRLVARRYSPTETGAKVAMAIESILQKGSFPAVLSPRPGPGPGR